ncbi:hypothetical protein [Sphingomonas sp. PP-CC-3A-396]|uniref:hypothetical protein n=1 Tax=Sphingomonas sp. PP-CC-3A-396 TaxID=2135655 RepID=UPI001052172F|nr:hypothetical protein [Sphingomonas sp. PP-CC-3A-396]TCQ02858.1 hypothetical protein C8J40_11427 [Sphingomonas sp. PP-CC-3A-396]
MTSTSRHFPGIAYKGALGLLLVLLLWLSMAVSFDGVFSRRDPTVALQWAPWSSAAKVVLSTSLATNNPTDAAAIAEARTLAQQALNRSPVQASAARAIGVSALSARNNEAARRAFTYAARLSRRDLPTELYWIEANVTRGDIRGALHHYDIAMNVSVKSRAMLGNILIAASAETDVANELAKLLKTQPRWLPEFYQRLMGQGENPATLFHIANVMAFDARDPGQAPFVSMALNRLVALGAYENARALYSRSVGGPNETVRNAGFERANRLQPFDWTIASEPTYSGIIETRTGWPHGNVLTVTGTEANDVARQLLLLVPGQYRLAADTANVRQERETRPLLTIMCVSNNRALASMPFAAAGAKPAVMQGTFTVPANCPAQWITIRNTPSFDPVDSDPWIDRIVVQRIER